MELSEEQQLVFNKYIEGNNIFMTGPGGTGKSELIKNIYNDALKKGKKISVTALTGCAALLLQCKAKTIHSWAGIGIANGEIPAIVRRVSESKFKKANWKTADILIIDEVSMLSKKLFELLDKIGRTIRKHQSHLPFGGIQIIFSGDFYQLPPVGSRDELETQQFCFESEDWSSTFHHQIQLKKIFRQKDPLYADILNQIREGVLKRSSNNKLLEYVGKKPPADSVVQPTKLYPTRSKVEQINNMEMAKLTCDATVYRIKQMCDVPITSLRDRDLRGQYNDKDIEIELNYLQGNLPCENEISLKVGAQVMFTVNLDLPDGRQLCNGSQGIITHITDQGPLVKFNNGVEYLVQHHVWTSESIPGIGVAQIPLILAWALTIHKSQGASLDIAEIDVGSGIFECGQTYVALSRVKSLEGLYLSSFDAQKIRINKKVKQFYISTFPLLKKVEQNPL